MQAYEERAPVALCLPCSPHRLLSIYENPEREKKSWGPLGCELWAFDVRLFEFYPWRTRQCPLVWIGRLKVLITTCSTSHLFQIHDLHVSCDMCFFLFFGALLRMERADRFAMSIMPSVNLIDISPIFRFVLGGTTHERSEGGANALVWCLFPHSGQSLCRYMSLL